MNDYLNELAKWVLMELKNTVESSSQSFPPFVKEILRYYLINRSILASVSLLILVISVTYFFKVLNKNKTNEDNEMLVTVEDIDPKLFLILLIAFISLMIFSVCFFDILKIVLSPKLFILNLISKLAG